MEKTFACRTAAAVLLSLTVLCGRARAAGIDTVFVSELYTTHLIFQTDIKYGDCSNNTDILSAIVEQDRNICAMKAVAPFTSTANVSFKESNGRFHTFIVAYRQHPGRLYMEVGVDISVPRSDGTASAPEQSVPEYSVQQGGRRSQRDGRLSVADGRSVSDLNMVDAPLLSDVIGYKRSLYHLSTSVQRIRANCENIFAYSDITYITVSVENRSGVSYETEDATFTVEDNGRFRRKVKAEPLLLLPKNRYGRLTVAPGNVGKVAYTLDKVTLAPDQVLKICFYEKNGKRNLAITLSPEDVNLASRPKI